MIKMIKVTKMIKMIKVMLRIKVRTEERDVFSISLECNIFSFTKHCEWPMKHKECCAQNPRILRFDQRIGWHISGALRTFSQAAISLFLGNVKTWGLVSAKLTLLRHGIG